MVFSVGDKVLLIPVGNKLGSASYYAVKSGGQTVGSKTVLIPTGSALASASYISFTTSPLSVGDKVIVMPVGNSLSSATWIAFKSYMPSVTYPVCSGSDPCLHNVNYQYHRPIGQNNHWRWTPCLSPSKTISGGGYWAPWATVTHSIVAATYGCTTAIHVSATQQIFGAGSGTGAYWSLTLAHGTMYNTTASTHYAGGRVRQAYRIKGVARSIYDAGHVGISVHRQDPSGKNYNLPPASKSFTWAATYSFPVNYDTGWRTLRTSTLYGEMPFQHTDEVYQIYCLNYKVGATITFGPIELWLTDCCAAATYP